MLAQITWHQNVAAENPKDREERLWCARAAVRLGWSRKVLVLQIGRLPPSPGEGGDQLPGDAPEPQWDLVQELLEDPYDFDFLPGDDARERGLLEHIRSFLPELGVGFAFVGSQNRIEGDGRDFLLDLLFYHLKLRCYVVVELKTTEFRPEYAGKMDFYLSAVDDLLRHPEDEPGIGLILYKGEGRVMVEYALRDVGKPIGVSGSKLAESLPESYQGSLPTVADLEVELSEGGT